VGDLGGRRGRLISAPDRLRAVELIDEAHAGGARLFMACRELGISIRTRQRWIRDAAPGRSTGTAERTPFEKNRLQR